ncbi:MAG: ribosome small subunit-dependent GTPase A [Betaproteobacteria bacterium HGW-Betaproteobacteria-11]|nr:MAG: ribosome small subunit-dependent GTPase A [Betaproteobacteria bacterium HGW-Betaproteobacteria-11]
MQHGCIVAAFGRHYQVELADGRRTTGFPRGKKSQFAVGDSVTLSETGQIEAHEPRRSLLYRSDAFRQKLIAANVSQVVLVVATEPSFSDLLLTRALVAAEDQELKALIVLNKIDRAAALVAARACVQPFAALGYQRVELSARQDAAPLRPWLEGETSVLIGQSGMGKSTLINALIPEAAMATREISTALDSGKHTTTHARLFRLNQRSIVIDCPGLQEFGLAHLTPEAIAYGFVEFRPHLGHCRFRDCRHAAEPDCAIKQAVAAGEIDPRRLEHFHQLIRESVHGSH